MIEGHIRNAVRAAGKKLDLMSMMGMNRHERRALARVNRIKNIRGSNKPFVRKANATGTTEKTKA